MRRILASLCLCAILAAASAGVVRAHCEIPCGIYGDKMRVAMLYEHIGTVEKSMQQISTLAADPAANANQLVRWVGNKEDHCNEIQQIVTQYFMTQRVKPAPAEDPAARKQYLARLEALHGMLLHAMKAKQTTDLAHVEKLRKLVDTFSKLYFDEKDLEHLREHHK